MKKFLLFIPISLLAASSVFWLSGESQQASVSSAVKVQDAVALFGQSEHALKQMIRHGDEKSLGVLSASLKELDGKLVKYHKQGISVDKADVLITEYTQDSAEVAHVITPYLQKLQSTDVYEQQNEGKFKASLDQIGLYELKATFEKLELARMRYIKKPSLLTQDEYRELSVGLKSIIRELYLDSTIENPLYAYIDNHDRYFQAVVAVYNKVGMEKIERLSLNEYAIKGELQLLPKL